MRIIPVLDLKAGTIVRGIAGRRQEYQPMASRLATSSVPLDVAHAFRDCFGSSELYLADLDAIAGGPPAREVSTAIRALGCRLWVDAGVRDLETALPLIDAEIDKVVIGLETIAGPEALEEICRKVTPERIAFSLDLKDGKPLGDTSEWSRPDAWSIAAQAVTAGVNHLIVLDLARVGVGGGTGTEELCQRLASQFPHVEIVAGGGVRHLQDLRRLSLCGIDAALVASALHDGKLSREDVWAAQRWTGRHS